MIHLFLFIGGKATDEPERSDYLHPIPHDCEEGLHEFLEYYNMNGDADIYSDPEARELIAEIRTRKKGGWKPTLLSGQYYRIIPRKLF